MILAFNRAAPKPERAIRLDYAYLGNNYPDNLYPNGSIPNVPGMLLVFLKC